MNLKNNRGFTLVELLIVVAIIGVLATIAIPNFRTALFKAKQSEVKVNFGGLFTSEAGFYAEYGGYSNSLKAIGFQISGVTGYSSVGLNYSFGFPVGGTCLGVVTLVPETGEGPRDVIDAAMPTWADNWGAADGENTHVYVKKYGVDAGGSSVYQGECLEATIAGAGATYTATATGALRGGLGAAAKLEDMDQWTMTHERKLSNLKQGF